MPYTSGVQIDRMNDGIIVSFSDGKVAFVTHQTLHGLAVDSAAHDVLSEEDEPADNHEPTAHRRVY